VGLKSPPPGEGELSSFGVPEGVKLAVTYVASKKEVYVLSTAEGGRRIYPHHVENNTLGQ